MTRRQLTEGEIEFARQTAIDNNPQRVSEGMQLSVAPQSDDNGNAIVTWTKITEVENSEPPSDR